MSPRRLAIGVRVAAALLAPVGLCAADAADGRVTIDNFSFGPASVTVAVGTRVVWLNRDDIPHQVVGRDDPKAIHSAPLDTNDSYAFTFTQAGTYAYFCGLHPFMQGTVVVH